MHFRQKLLFFAKKVTLFPVYGALARPITLDPGELGPKRWPILKAGDLPDQNRVQKNFFWEHDMKVLGLAKGSPGSHFGAPFFFDNIYII